MRETSEGWSLFKSLFGKAWRLPVFLFLFAAVAYAQEGPALSPSQNVIEMDIRTSTLSELAAWSRRHGLPEGGTSADLARRLREHYGLPLEGQVTVREGQRVITIESARVTEYFTIYAVDEEYARLSGDVFISLRDGDAVHEIQAWDILFNRTRNIISASGGVLYRRTEGDTIETFRGDSITVDLDNWASIFLGGVTERALEGEGTTYLFAGTVISRDEEEVTVLRSATISSAGEESLWSLRASRVWLLPGSDFAIFNAVLRVGEIPVFYIPFFFFPADQMIFHPAIGTRTREGNFVNTTTYILGRPRNEGGSESSLTRILGAGGDMERQREGLFLRSTGTRAAPDGGPSLALLVDYYSNLGAYIGTEMALPGRGLLGTTSLSAGIGLTRTLVPPSVSGVGYTPFWPDFDGEVDWNHSQFFAFRVPFRYRFLLSGSISGRYGNLNWRLPHYSDPFVDRDFMNRMTEMDWLGMLQQGASAMEAQDITQQSLSNYIWELRGQIQPRFPDMRPFITNISLDPITSTLQFRTIRTPDDPENPLINHSPMRHFFAPDHATLYRTRVSITGNPLRLGEGRTGPAIVAPAPLERENPLENIGVPISPFAVPEEDEPPPPRDPADTLVPPVLAQRFDVPRPAAANVSFGLDYSLTPGSASTLRFDGGEWREFDDVDWTEIRSVLTNFSGSGRVGLNFRFHDNFFVNTFTLSGSGTWQQYSYLNEEATEFQFVTPDGDPDTDRINTALANARLQHYRQSNFTTSYNLDTNFRPFHRHPVFGASGIRHNMAGLAVRSEFTSTVDDLLDGGGPEWDLVYGRWNDERITAHQLIGTFGARVMDLNQTLTFTTHLPPRDRAYLMTGNFNVWITNTTANWGIRFPDSDRSGVHDPFNLTHTITVRNFGNFSQTFQVNTEDVELTRLTSQLNMTRWGLMLRFRASYIRGFEFDPEAGGGAAGAWVQRGEDEQTLRPEDFFIQYGRRFETRPRSGIINNFFARVDSSTTFNLQRFTDSRFTFGLGAGVDTRFMRLSLTANSDNNDIFRYFRNWPLFRDAPIELPDGRQNNLFLDLIDSFRFGSSDEAMEARRRSGFKIRGLTLRAERSLGDWDASLDWRMTPYRPRTPGARVEMHNFVTFMVRWIPITEFRSEIRYDPRDDFQTWTVEGL